MLWVFDLDGVVWLAGRPIPGSPEAIARLRAAGEQVVFVTNNSGPTVAEYVSRLGAAGVEANSDELATSAQAAAMLVAPGTPVAMVGGEGVNEALRARGLKLVGFADGPAAVIVGRSVKLDFDELTQAATAIRAGARFIATNTDATFPTPSGLTPGAGALIAFLQVASGRQAEIAGKPHQAVADLVRARFGQPHYVVGDSLATDGAFAALLHAPFALVLTGVTRREDLPATPAPDIVGADLAEVVNRLLDGAPR